MYINIYIWCILYTYILDIHYISMKCIQIYIYIYTYISACTFYTKMSTKYRAHLFLNATIRLIMLASSKFMAVSLRMRAESIVLWCCNAPLILQIRHSDLSDLSHCSLFIFIFILYMYIYIYIYHILNISCVLHNIVPPTFASISVPQALASAAGRGRGAGAASSLPGACSGGGRICMHSYIYIYICL